MRWILIFLVLFGFDSHGQKFGIKRSTVKHYGKKEKSQDINPLDESVLIDTSTSRIVWEVEGDNDNVIFKISSSGIVKGSKDIYYSCETNKLNSDQVTEWYVVHDATYKCFILTRLGLASRMVKINLYYE